MTEKKLNNLIDFKTFTEKDIFKENKPTKRTGVAKDVLKEDVLNEREYPDVKGFIFPKTHSKVIDNQNHFPIGNIDHGRNALARAGAFTSTPKWYNGTLSSFKNAIKKAVSKSYPSIEIAE